MQKDYKNALIEINNAIKNCNNKLEIEFLKKKKLNIEKKHNNT